MGRDITDIQQMPVMARKCKTCPFGPNGSREVRESVEARLLTVSQTCHSTGVIHGKEDTHICRGARDWQQTFFHRIGFLKEPTDEAWEEKMAEVGLKKAAVAVLLLLFPFASFAEEDQPMRLSQKPRLAEVHGQREKPKVYVTEGGERRPLTHRTMRVWRKIERPEATFFYPMGGEKHFRRGKDRRK